MKSGYCHSATWVQGQCFSRAPHAAPSVLVLLLVIQICPALFHCKQMLLRASFSHQYTGMSWGLCLPGGRAEGKCNQIGLVSKLNCLGVRCSPAAIVGKVWLLVSLCPAGSEGCWGGTSRASTLDMSSKLLYLEPVFEACSSLVPAVSQYLVLCYI